MILAQVCVREESWWRGWGRDLPDIDAMSGRSRISRPRIFGTRFRLLASDLSILKWNLLERKRDLRRRLRRRRRCRRRRRRRRRRQRYSSSIGGDARSHQRRIQIVGATQLHFWAETRKSGTVFNQKFSVFFLLMH